MGYTIALKTLQKLTPEEYAAIPPCDREVVIKRELQKTIEGQAVLFELCRSISPTREESAKSSRPFPRYIPVKTIKQGGEAYLLVVEDQWRKEQVMLKVPFPKFKHDEIETKRVVPPHSTSQVLVPGKVKDIVKDSKGLMEIGKSIYRNVFGGHKKDETEPLKFFEEPTKEEKDVSDSSLYERFHRSFLFQEQCHRTANRVDPERKYGYIPKTLEFGFHPACYFTQELIRGKGWMNWVQTHNDHENYELFLKLVIFIEKVLHEGRGLAHCDIKPGNVLIYNNAPVLLDFGISKAPSLSGITMDDAQLGSRLDASESQLQDSKNRGFIDDVVSLGRLLHSTLTRRRPSLSGVLESFSMDGKVSIDREVIERLFHPALIQDIRYRGIFIATQESGYQDISEFRADLEGILFGSRVEMKCQEPCPELLLVQEKLKMLKELFGENI